jgi:hypothetical protein
MNIQPDSEVPMAFVEGVARLFGASIVSAEITAFLASHPHRVGKPSDGNQYVISPEGGFDLLFSDADSAPRRAPQQRTLAALFLFSAGTEKHQQFNGELPFGFSFRDKRQTLVAKQTPDRTWVNGRGRVPYTCTSPSSDSWCTELFNITAHYREDGSVRHFQTSPPEAYSGAMAPPTWQELALMPGQKSAAIKLYMAEHGANTVEAKRAVDCLITAADAPIPT